MHASECLFKPCLKFPKFFTFLGCHSPLNSIYTGDILLIKVLCLFVHTVRLKRHYMGIFIQQFSDILLSSLKLYIISVCFFSVGNWRSVA